VLVSADHEAVHPPRRVVRIERDAVGVLEQLGEHDSRSDAGQACADAVVDAAPEREMVTRSRPLEIDFVGPFDIPADRVATARPSG
jgi:hypothetical protein